MKTWPALMAIAMTGFSLLSYQQAAGLRDGTSVQNVALTDGARTSELKGEITDAVNTVFSYDYADVAKTERAVKELLTGDAVRQHDSLFGPIRAQSSEQKLVLTTTVTDSAVMSLTGDRARLLVFADQLSTGTAEAKTSYSAAMLAVDAIHRNGHWMISNIDTF